MQFEVNIVNYYRIRYDDKYLVNSSFNFLNIWSNDNKAIIGQLWIMEYF